MLTKCARSHLVNRTMTNKVIINETQTVYVFFTPNVIIPREIRQVTQTKGS